MCTEQRQQNAYPHEDQTPGAALSTRDHVKTIMGPDSHHGVQWKGMWGWNPVSWLQLVCMAAVGRYLKLCLPVISSVPPGPVPSGVAKPRRVLCKWCGVMQTRGAREQQSTTFVAPGTGFVEDSFPRTGMCGWARFRDDSSALHLPCTLFLLLFHQPHLGSSSIRYQRLGTPALQMCPALFRTWQDIMILNGNVSVMVKLHRFSKKIKVNSRASWTNNCHFSTVTLQ